MKKILILTAGYGEGHNAAARGVRDGLARVAPDAVVEMRDLFAEAYGTLHKTVREAYLALINRWPRSWGIVYWWLDHKKDFDKNFARFTKLKDHLGRLLASFQPDVVVSTFPAYPYVIEQILGPNRVCKNIAVVTDSITVNAIWYRSWADYLLVPNEQSAEVVRTAGIAPEKIKTFGFPVSPQFADLVLATGRVRPSGGQDRQWSRREPSDIDGQPERVTSREASHQSPSQNNRRVLYVISSGTAKAPELVRKLLDLNIDLTVTVGRNDQLRSAIESTVGDRKLDIVGWTNELPRMLCRSHLLISKAGGATVQETIAASCPMIINHVVSGQEQGNARLIVETNSGAIALSNDEVVAQVERAFADDAKQWREWSTNISKLSRPRASLDIAEFLLSI